MRAALAWMVCLPLLGCGREPARDPAGLEVEKPVASTSPPVEPPPAERDKSPRIVSGAVGDFVVGSPIPAHHLEGAPKYHARWVADAQPMEGFLFGTPPVWVTIEDGPMKDVEPGPVEQLEPTLAPKALEAAKKGARVSSILIEQPGLVTEAGIGVGSSYEVLKAAYGELSLVVNPELFDSNPTCHVRAKVLPGVSFLLETCKKGMPPGAVKRVWVGEP